MTTRWLLVEIANELELEAYWHIDDTFNEIKKALANKSFTIIIDEVDYLIEKKSIETLRDNKMSSCACWYGFDRQKTFKISPFI